MFNEISKRKTEEQHKVAWRGGYLRIFAAFATVTNRNVEEAQPSHQLGRVSVDFSIKDDVCSKCCRSRSTVRGDTKKRLKRVSGLSCKVCG